MEEKIILTLILLTVYTCNSDDIEDPIDQNIENLINTWKFLPSSTNGVEDNDFYFCDLEETLQFTNNKPINTFYYDPSETNGSECQLDEIYVADYSISGSIINIEDEEETFSVEIITLNDTTLTIEDRDENSIFTITYTKT